MFSGEPYSDDSDDEAREIETVGDCRGAVDDSDAEIDDSEDPLKHAGTYTAEEVTLIARDKLIKLQALYADYLNVLKRRYQRKRVEFHKRVKSERDTVGPLRTAASTPRQKLKLEQLGAWRRYHRHFGEEGLLYDQSQKRRRLVAGTPNEKDTNESVQLCNALVNGMDCGEMALPDSSMCAKHILCDGRQVLFFKCEVDDCRNVCIPTSDIKVCWFHQRNSDSIRHDFNVSWGSFSQTAGASSISHQRPSVFAAAAPPLRVYAPPSSTQNGGGASAQPSSQPQSQKSPGNLRQKRKSGGSGVGGGGVNTTTTGFGNIIGSIATTTPTNTMMSISSSHQQGRAPMVAVRRGSGQPSSRSSLVMHRPAKNQATGAANKRSASVDEAGVYGAYMSPNDPSDRGGPPTIIANLASASRSTDISVANLDAVMMNNRPSV